MVARITTGKSIAGVIYYNEHKVDDDDARCIEAVGFGMDHSRLTLREKVHRFQKQTRRNQIAKTNAVHISLNFAPEEKLSRSQLQNIAARYLSLIGFGDQPYLVYEHSDAGHPHIHIVTTNIRNNGSRINTHLIGEKIGMQAREQVEKEFGLIRATERKNDYLRGIAPADLAAIELGTRKNRQTVSNIVRAVNAKYQFTTLTEYNLILRQFNVVADQGEEGTIIREYGGLVYSVIDANGNKRGSQVKASSIYINTKAEYKDHPTLKYLQFKFAQSHQRRQPYREALLRKIDAALDAGVDFDEFKSLLSHEHVEVVPWYNQTGAMGGLTFIDNATGVAFSGSQLKKGYGAAGINARLITADRRQRQANERLLAVAEHQTDFRIGFASVMELWKGKGIHIQARRLEDGRVYFFLGEANLPAESYVPVSRRLGSYLYVNILGRSAKGSPTQLSSHPVGSHHQPLSGQSATWPVIVSIKDISDILTMPGEDYNYVPAPLLRESKKKNYKKRKPRS